MPGLPHFLNNRAASKLFEPVYQNNFEVTIIPPSSVAGGEILLEHVNKIGGLDSDKGSAAVDQKYKFAKRSYASGEPTDTVTDLTIDFSLNLNNNNEMYVYKTLRDWSRLIYDPLSGRQGLKKDYVGTIIVQNYTRDGQIFWQRTFHDCFITGNIPALELTYEGGAVLELPGVAFRCDWFEEAML